MPYVKVPPPPEVKSSQFKGWISRFWNDFADEGSWTPAPTFATPGNVAFTPTTAVGDWRKHGRMIFINFTYIGTLTHTTASGDMQINGLPFPSANSPGRFWGAGFSQFSGITKAGFASVGARIDANASRILLIASGSGVAASRVQATDVPTAGTVVLAGSFSYWI